MPVNLAVPGGRATMSVGPGPMWPPGLGPLDHETIEQDTNLCRNPVPTASFCDKPDQQGFELEQQASPYYHRDAAVEDDIPWASQHLPMRSPTDGDPQQNARAMKEGVRGSDDQGQRRKKYCRTCKLWFGSTCPQGASCRDHHLNFRQRQCTSALCHSRFTVEHQSEAGSSHMTENQGPSAIVRNMPGHPNHESGGAFPKEDLGLASGRSALPKRNCHDVFSPQSSSLGDSWQKDHATEEFGRRVEDIRHRKGQCKPCVFWFYGCCDRGRECGYCHILHTKREYRNVASRFSKLTSERLFNALELQQMLEHRPASAKLVLRF